MSARTGTRAPKLRYAVPVAIGSLFVLLLTLPSAGQTAAESGYVGDDPTKFQTTKYPETPCGECHLAEWTVWQTTRHAKGFKDLHRRESAETIKRNMGLPLIKRDSPCLSCHYTPNATATQLKAVSGVSCESCHGASDDWINVHNDYGPGGDYKSETAEHKAQRFEQSRVAGMRRADDLYGVVSRCYQCHFVLDQELVNVGQHNTGSGAFELVEWSQGNIRHNFLQALVGGSEDNAERPAERKRVMHVVGRALELEYGLRGMAQATDDKGSYAKAMSQRVSLANRKLKSIGRKIDSPEVNAILGEARDANVRINNGPELLAAAERIGAQIQSFIAQQDGSQLAAVDEFLQEDADEPAVAQAGTAPAGQPGASASGQPATSATGQSGSTASGQPGAAGDQPGTPAASQAPGTSSTATAGASHDTLGFGTCSGCHAPQNDWLRDDPHGNSEAAFFDEVEANLQIGARYGLSLDEMLRGTSRCMDCHSTVATAKKRREVDGGVNCEACHGPAKDYLEPHREGDKSLGLQRPGYINALRLGMFELKTAAVRARVCTDCHHITETKLLQAGHGSGKGFDNVGGMSKINHWEGQSVTDGDLRAALDTVLAARGAAPQVAVAGQPPGGTPSTTVESETTAQAEPTAPTPAATPSPAAPSTPTPEPTPSIPLAPPPTPPTASAGELKTRIRPVSAHETIGPSSCSATCHKLQNEWWVDDAHYATADPFLDALPKAQQIARKYGIKPESMAKGNQVCMDCHGTVVTRKLKRTVGDGVGCEECHGPAKDYLEPHQQEGGDGRDTRPGYLQALQLGLVKLRDLDVRAEVCTGCHVITDSRLISTGHPRGNGFDFIAGMQKIRHWEAEPAAEGLLQAAFGKALGARGVKKPKRGVPVTDRPQTSAPIAANPVPPSAPVARPVATQATRPSSINLAQFPEIDDSASVEEILILLKQRLEELHRAVHGTP